MTTVDTYLFLINNDIPAEIMAAATQMMMSGFCILKRKKQKSLCFQMSVLSGVLLFHGVKIDDAKVMFRCLFCGVYFLRRTMMLTRRTRQNDAS